MKKLAPPEVAPLAKSIRALADTSRLQIVSVLAASPGRKVRSVDLENAVNVAPATMYHHLRTLHRAGLVERTRVRGGVYHRLVPTAFTAIARALR